MTLIALPLIRAHEARRSSGLAQEMIPVAALRARRRECLQIQALRLRKIVVTKITQTQRTGIL